MGGTVGGTGRALGGHCGVGDATPPPARARAHTHHPAFACMITERDIHAGASFLFIIATWEKSARFEPQRCTLVARTKTWMGLSHQCSITCCTCHTCWPCTGSASSACRPRVAPTYRVSLGIDAAHGSQHASGAWPSAIYGRQLGLDLLPRQPHHLAKLPSLCGLEGVQPTRVNHDRVLHCCWHGERAASEAAQV